MKTNTKHRAGLVIGASLLVMILLPQFSRKLPLEGIFLETSTTNPSFLDIMALSSFRENKTQGPNVLKPHDPRYELHLFTSLEETRMSSLVVGSPALQAGTRVTEDQPDDSDLYQVQALYVLPSDGQDDALDINGTIASSVIAFQNWLALQTGGSRLRFDTYQGKLDIVFHHLNRTDADIARAGAYVRNEIERELRAAGFDKPNKLYAVYYGGSSTHSCGAGAWPPALVGNVAAVYIRGSLFGGQVRCDDVPFTQSIGIPGYWEFAMLHELLHSLGFVPTCGANSNGSAHVNNSPADLMYTGPQKWQPSILDVDRNDYYQHGIPGCLDLADSAFLDPLPPDPVKPPGWPQY